MSGSHRYTNGSRVSGILKRLRRNRSLPVHQLKVKGDYIRRPEPSIEVLRKQGWNIDTYKVPEGKGSVYILNEDPAEMLDKGFEILFMAQAKVALDVRQASRRKVVSIYNKRTGDQERRLSP